MQLNFDSVSLMSQFKAITSFSPSILDHPLPFTTQSIICPSMNIYCCFSLFLLLSSHSQVSVFPVHSFLSMLDSMLLLLHLQRDCLLIIHDFSFPVHPFLFFQSSLHRSRKVIVVFSFTTSLNALVPSSRISLAVIQPSFHSFSFLFPWFLPSHHPDTVSLT